MRWSPFDLPKSTDHVTFVQVRREMLARQQNACICGRGSTPYAGRATRHCATGLPCTSTPATRPWWTGTCCAHVTVVASFRRSCFYNSDGDFLIGLLSWPHSLADSRHICAVPQEGAITLRTELGVLRVAPNEISVVQVSRSPDCCAPSLHVQRGIRYAVEVEGPSRYILCCLNHTHV